MGPRSVLPFLFLLAAAEPCHAQWHLSAYLGGAHTQSTDLSLSQASTGTQLSLRGVDFEGKSFQGPPYYGFRGGYFFSRHLGLDAEFIHLKVFAQTEKTVDAEGTLQGNPIHAAIPMSNVIQRFSISHGLNLLLADAVLRQDFLRRPGERLGPMIVSARVGLGGTIPHPESEVLGASNQHYEGGPFALQLAGGAEYRLWHGLHVLAEYKYTRTRQHVGVTNGTIGALFQSHHLVTGFDYSF